jgi:hypothetical protein
MLIRPATERLEEFALRLLDRTIVDAGKASHHEFDSFICVMTNGKVTEDKVGHHRDLLTRIPVCGAAAPPSVIGVPASFANSRRKSDHSTFNAAFTVR